MKGFKNLSNKVYSHKINSDVIDAIPVGVETLLDIGCGKGENGKEISKRNITIDAITYSPQEADLVKLIYRDVYLYNLEEGLPSISSKYDCIVCSHVLEHIAYPTKLLKAIHNQLHEGGYFIIALPNLLNYRSRIQLLFGNFEYENQGTWDYTHVRWYTYSSAKKLLINNGFTVEKAWVGGDLPFLSVSKIIPFRMRKKIFSLLTLLSPGLFGKQLLYIAKKAV